MNKSIVPFHVHGDGKQLQLFVLFLTVAHPSSHLFSACVLDLHVCFSLGTSRQVKSNQRYPLVFLRRIVLTNVCVAVERVFYHQSEHFAHVN